VPQSATLDGKCRSAYEGLVAKDPASLYRAGPTRAWLEVKVRYEGRFLLGGVAVSQEG